MKRKLRSVRASKSRKRRKPVLRRNIRRAVKPYRRGKSRIGKGKLRIRRRLKRRPIRRGRLRSGSGDGGGPAYNNGFNQAYNEGYNAGFSKGFEDGHQIAYEQQV